MKEHFFTSFSKNGQKYVDLFDNEVLSKTYRKVIFLDAEKDQNYRRCSEIVWFVHHQGYQ